MPEALEQVDHGAVEGGETVGRRSTRAQGWVAPHQPLLERVLVLVEQGDGDRSHIRIAPVEGGPADAGGPGDVLHRDGLRIAAPEEALRSRQHPLAVARGVGALAAR